MESSNIMNLVIFFISVQLVEVEATQLHDAVIGMFVSISIAFIMLVTAIAISCKIFVCVDRSSQGSVLQSNVQTSLPHTSLMASNSPHSVTNPAYNLGENTAQPGTAGVY